MTSTNARGVLSYFPDEKVSIVKTWIGSSEYRSPYERARRSRYRDTGQWFLELEEYGRWRDSKFSLEQPEDPNIIRQSWQRRVLFVQGKSLRRQ